MTVTSFRSVHRLLPAAAALAAAAVLALPATASAASCKPALFDSEPTLWDFDGDLQGDIFDGAHYATGTWRDDAFDSYGRLLVDVQGGAGPVTYGAPSLDACGREDGDREVVFPAVTIDGLEVSRKVFVPASGTGFIRWLDVLSNPTNATLTATVRFLGTLGAADPPNPATTAVFATSSGDATTTTADTWAATDDGGLGDPQIAHVWDEAVPARADAADSLTLANNNANVNVQYNGVSIAAGGTAIFMHLAALRSSRAAATAAAQALQTGSGPVFFGLSAGEGDALRNWVGADFDRDGHANTADNCPYATNDQADVDADGAGDPCDGDADGDGLSNADEERLGTNPLAADSDGDGTPDGADVCPLRRGVGVDGCDDTTAPGVTVARFARRIRRARLLRVGMSAKVACTEPCSVRVSLLRSSRGLRLSRAGDVVLGEQLYARRVATRRTVRVKPLRRFRRALRPGTRITLRVVASDAAGNRRTVNRRIVVR